MYPPAITLFPLSKPLYVLCKESRFDLGVSGKGRVQHLGMMTRMILLDGWLSKLGGTLNNRCRIIIGTQKGTIILTTTHMKSRECRVLTSCLNPHYVHSVLWGTSFAATSLKGKDLSHQPSIPDPKFRRFGVVKRISDGLLARGWFYCVLISSAEARLQKCSFLCWVLGLGFSSLGFRAQVPA